MYGGARQTNKQTNKKGAQQTNKQTNKQTNRTRHPMKVGASLPLVRKMLMCCRRVLIRIRFSNCLQQGLHCRTSHPTSLCFFWKTSAASHGERCQAKRNERLLHLFPLWKIALDIGAQEGRNPTTHICEPSQLQRPHQRQTSQR